MFRRVTIKEQIREERNRNNLNTSNQLELELQAAQSAVESLELMAILNEAQEIEQAQANTELIELILSIGGM